MRSGFIFLLLGCIFLINITHCSAADDPAIIDNFEIIKNQMSLARNNFERGKSLLDEGIICPKEYKELENKYLKLKEAYDLSECDGLGIKNGREVKYYKVYHSEASSSSNLENLKNKYTNMQHLYEDGIISQKELLNAELDYKISYVFINTTQNHFERDFQINKLLNPLDIILKTALKYVSSTFGYRVNPVTGIYSLHEGIDIAVPEGTPVYAYSDGLVKTSTKGAVAGNYIVITHGSGYATRYLHLQKATVKQNQFVKQGEIIGYAGNTGRSTGPHLHFELLKQNRAQNINKLIGVK
jgi:murein DD-endopeptidase MepM/ murein hydrolase activator NlpD